MLALSPALQGKERLQGTSCSEGNSVIMKVPCQTHIRDVFRQAGWRHILHLEQREVKFRIILPLQEHSLSSSAPAERELSPDHRAFPYSKQVSCDRAVFWPLLLPEMNAVSNSYSEGKHYCWEQHELLRQSSLGLLQYPLKLTDFKVKKALGQLHVTCE